MIQTWIIWAVIGLALAILELFLPGLTVICLSVGAFASALAAWLQASFTVQMLVFSIVSLLSFVAIRPLLLALINRQKPGQETNVQAIIGKRGFVTTEIQANGERGWVKIENEEWPAITRDQKSIAQNTEIVVKAVEGNTLVVDDLTGV